MNTYLTSKEEKRLLKHLQKWGVPFQNYAITYVASTIESPSFIYFNTEKYQIRFFTGENISGGIDNIVKRQFELRGEHPVSLNKDKPHTRDAQFGGYYCPCNQPIYYSTCSSEKMKEIKTRVGSLLEINLEK